jgi:hypothetical protein
MTGMTSKVFKARQSLGLHDGILAVAAVAFLFFLHDRGASFDTLAICAAVIGSALVILARLNAIYFALLRGREAREGVDVTGHE